MDNKRQQNDDGATIEVWSVKHNGTVAYQEHKPDDEEMDDPEVQVAKLEMLRDDFESLPDFEGF